MARTKATGRLARITGGTPVVRKVDAFTLLEILLAVTIFSMISLAVFQVFRVGTRAYRDSIREIAVLQRARFALDSFETDTSSLFFRDETSYNIAARQAIERYEEDRWQAEENRDWTEFEKRYGPRDGNTREQDMAESDSNYVGNPFETYMIIDLQMMGQDGGDQDTLTFAIRKPPTIGGPKYPLGLARVRYTLEGDLLVRSVESVETAPRDWQGEELEKEEPPEYSIIAQGVKAFDLAYAFWVDNQWYETGSWNSAGRQLRNPEYLLGEHDFTEEELRQIASGAAIRGTEAWNESLDEREEEPLDRVPAYVRLRLEITDPERPGRSHTFTQLFRMPNSVETWKPNENLEEEEQETERDARDESYLLVQPGAMRKEGSTRRR